MELAVTANDFLTIASSRADTDKLSDPDQRFTVLATPFGAALASLPCAHARMDVPRTSDGRLNAASALANLYKTPSLPKPRAPSDVWPPRVRLLLHGAQDHGNRVSPLPLSPPRGVRS